MAMYVMNSHGFPVGMYYSSFLERIHRYKDLKEKTLQSLVDPLLQENVDLRRRYTDRLEYCDDELNELIQSVSNHLATYPDSEEYDEECFQWDYNNVERYWADHAEHDFFETRDSLARMRSYEHLNNRLPFEVIKDRIAYKRAELLEENSSYLKKLLQVRKSYEQNRRKHGSK